MCSLIFLKSNVTFHSFPSPLVHISMSGALIGLVPRWGTPPNLRGGIRIGGGEGESVTVIANKEILTMTDNVNHNSPFLRTASPSAMRRGYQS